MSPLAAIAFPPLDPIAVRIGPLAVRWYGLAYVAGFLIAGLVVWWIARRWELGMSADDVVTIVLGCVVGVIIGGRLGYVVFYGLGDYLADPVDIFRVWDGGMSFHGGLVGILVAGAVLARVLRMPWLTLCDLGAVGAPAGIFFGRLANFVNAELWGRVTDVPWAIVFPNAGPLGRHPSQLYEAVLEGLAVLAIMVVLALKLPPRPRGVILGAFLACYGASRIAAEFFREPDVQIGFLPGGLTMGQLLSLPALVVGVVVIVWASRRALPQQGPARPS